MKGLFDNIKQLEEHPIFVKSRHIPFAGLIHVVSAFPSDLCRQFRHHPGLQHFPIAFFALQCGTIQSHSLQVGNIQKETATQPSRQFVCRQFRLGFQPWTGILALLNGTAKRRKRLQNKLYETVFRYIYGVLLVGNRQSSRNAVDMVANSYSFSQWQPILIGGNLF